MLSNARTTALPGLGASDEVLTRPKPTPNANPTVMATSVSWMVIQRPLMNSGV